MFFFSFARTSLTKYVFVSFFNSAEMAEKVEDDGNHVIGGIQRLRDRTLDYTSLITHSEDDRYLKMKERRERAEKQEGK